MPRQNARLPAASAAVILLSFLRPLRSLSAVLALVAASFALSVPADAATTCMPTASETGVSVSCSTNCEEAAALVDPTDELDLCGPYGPLGTVFGELPEDTWPLGTVGTCKDADLGPAAAEACAQQDLGDPEGWGAPEPFLVCWGGVTRITCIGWAGEFAILLF